MIQQKIEKIVQHASIGQLQSYSWLGAGFASDAYAIKTLAGSFVLLQAKENAAHQSNYEKYYANLKALEAASYKHAPRALYISNDKQSLLITKVAGRTIEQFYDKDTRIQKKIAINITNALMALGDVEPHIVTETYQTLGLPPPTPISESLDWKIYVTDRFLPFTPHAPQDAQTDWIEKLISSNKPSVSKYSQAVFTHGDTSAPNIIIDDNLGVTFIDWGDASLYLRPPIYDYGVAYTLNHVNIMRTFKNEVLGHVITAKQIPTDQLQDLICNKQRIIKIADITWAYMMYCRTSSNDIIDSPSKFKKILYRRIEEYKKDFRA